VPPFLSAPPRVKLVNAFARPFDGVVAAARTCYSAKGIVTPEEVGGDGLSDPAERERRLGRRDALARDVYLAGHHTTFQHAHVQFTLENVSRQLVWSFLHAHPHYNSEQTSQRYVEVKPGAFAVPPLAGEALAVYREACERQTEAYRRLGDLLVPVAARAFYATFRGRETQPASAGRRRSRSAPSRWPATSCPSPPSRRSTTRSRPSPSSATGGSPTFDAPTSSGSSSRR
jgi:hypothetical protein